MIESYIATEKRLSVEAEKYASNEGGLYFDRIPTEEHGNTKARGMTR